MAKDSIYAFGKSETERIKAFKKAENLARYHKVDFIVQFGTGTFGGYWLMAGISTESAVYVALGR